jgi:hypothetical protein
MEHMSKLTSQAILSLPNPTQACPPILVRFWAWAQCNRRRPRCSRREAGQNLALAPRAGRGPVAARRASVVLLHISGSTQSQRESQEKF